MSRFQTVLLLVLAIAAPAARAQTIGKHAPEIKFEDEQNKQRKDEEKFLIDEHRGHMLLMYFWRTNNIQSVQTRKEIKKLYDKYKDRGVRVVEMIVDSKEKYDKYVKDHPLDDIDGWKIWGARYVQPYYGAFSEPFVVIVDGRSIIRWRGDPSDNLEQRLKHYLKRYPPRAGDDKWLTDRLHDVDKLIDKREFGKAYTVAKEISDITDESSPRHGAATSKMESLETKAGEWLKEAVADEKAEKYDKAARIVAEISVRFDKADVAHDAEREIGRMNGRRELKQKIRDATNNAKGEVLLDKAEDLIKSDDYESALDVYKKVRDGEDYKDTDAAKTAKKAMKQIEDDPEAQKMIAAKRAERMADRYIDIAERFTKAQLYDQARTYYQKLLSEYPDSDMADQAKQALKDLPT